MHQILYFHQMKNEFHKDIISRQIEEKYLKKTEKNSQKRQEKFKLHHKLEK